MSTEFDPSHWGALLADGVEECLSGWVTRCIVEVADVANMVVPAQEIDVAAHNALAAVMPRLRALLSADVDAQRGTPLTLIREAVSFPTEVLRRYGVPVVNRDPFAGQAFPTDVYNLSPGSWADIDESLSDAGLRWSVAKAFEYKRRHQPQA